MDCDFKCFFLIMSAPNHKSGSLYQIAYIADDLEAAANYWQSLGAGPFYEINDAVFIDIEVPNNGKSPNLSILLGYSGDTLIELIKVNDDPNGIFEGVSSGEPHHTALLVDSLDAFLQNWDGANGQLIFRGSFPTGTPIAYIDTRSQTGLMTELVTRDEAVQDMLTLMHAEAQSFNGEDLIRSFE